MNKFAFVLAASLVLAGGRAALADDSGHIGVDSLKSQQHEQHAQTPARGAASDRHAAANPKDSGCRNQPGCEQSNRREP